MSISNLLRAIKAWRADAIKNLNTDVVFVAEDELEEYLQKPLPFLVGKKGTGKTAFATKLRDRAPEQVFYTTFDEFAALYADIVKHQNSKDEDVKRTALQLAVCLTALPKWAKANGHKTKLVSLERWRTRICRPAYVPGVLAAVAGLMVRSPTDSEGAAVEVAFSKIRFHLNSRGLLKRCKQECVRIARRAHLIIFVDGIDDLSGFSDAPMTPENLEFLRTAIRAFYFWSRENASAPRLVGMLRPEFLDIARELALSAKIAEDESYPLQWDKGRLVDVLNHRIRVEYDKLLEGHSDKATLSPISNARALLGGDENDYQRILGRLFAYSFLRPRDVIVFLKRVAHHALATADPHQRLPLSYFDAVLEAQRQYLLKEMKAELSVTLPAFEHFINALIDLHGASGARVFHKRESFESAIQDVLLRLDSTQSAADVVNALYSAFAIGYRGAGNSRHFQYETGDATLPAGYEIVLHNLFHEVPRETLALVFDPAQDSYDDVFDEPSK